MSLPEDTTSDNINACNIPPQRFRLDASRGFPMSSDVPKLQSTAVPVGSMSYQTASRGAPLIPPPVPPRATSQVHYRQAAVPVAALPYGSYAGMPFGRYHHGSSAYTPYGAYGIGTRYGYGQGYNNLAELGEAETALIRLAEESSRPAFQSIESLVNTVGSISMMLESTYYAVYSSYRAVLGVVENFSRLKSHIAKVISSLAVLRTLHWLALRLLYYLRLRETNPSVEAAWSTATDLAKKQVAAGGSPPHSSWPIIMFLSMVFGAPWLIFRIFSKMAAKKTMAESEEQYFADALYEFRASQPGELSLAPGQRIVLAPKSQQSKVKGWLLASSNKGIGLVPSNYLRIYQRKPVKKVAAKPGVDQPAPAEEQTAQAMPADAPVDNATTDLS